MYIREDGTEALQLRGERGMDAGVRGKRSRLARSLVRVPSIRQTDTPI